MRCFKEVVVFETVFAPKEFLSNSILGSGGGTSCRAMAFCLGRPGSNPGTDYGFIQFRIAVNLFSLGVRLFLKM